MKLEEVINEALMSANIDSSDAWCVEKAVATGVREWMKDNGYIQTAVPCPRCTTMTDKHFAGCDREEVTKEGKNMTVKRLVVEEFVVTGKEGELSIGDKYSYFKDPETGKFYRPVAGFKIEGASLLTSFVEVVE